ncbi:MAG: HIT domain-containing protein [Bdellovibrionota bacterium]
MDDSHKIERLWAPWRLEHIRKHAQKADDAECVFCELSKMPCDENSLKLYQSKHCFVVMNRFPYNPNHLLIIPNGHIAMLTDVKGEAWNDLQSCMKASVDLLMDKIKPQGLNIGLNIGKAGGASIHEHLHFHVLPRWGGDTNFMPILAEAKMIPAHNLTIFNELMKYFKDFDTYLKAYL